MENTHRLCVAVLVAQQLDHADPTPSFQPVPKNSTPRNYQVVALVALGLALAACAPNAPTATPTVRFTPTIPPPTPPATSIRPTVPPVVALTPTPTPLVPTIPPQALATAVPSGGNCSNKYAFVSDVSIPDDTAVPAGQVFTKTWRVRNTGSCTWGDGYVLAFVRGQAMTSLESVPITRTAPNAEVDVSVLMTAPATAGSYQGFWAIKNPQGVALSPNLWVKVAVQ